MTQNKLLEVLQTNLKWNALTSPHNSLALVIDNIPQATNLYGRKTSILMCRRNTHGRVHWRRRRSRTIGAASRARVVLRSAPAQADTRVANGIPLHLVDGHLSGMALNKLHKPTAFAGRNLDVGDLAKSLEEGTQLILGDVARQTADKDRRVVGIGELVHRLLGRSVETHRRSSHRRVQASRTRDTHGTQSGSRALVLGRSRGNAHGTITAVHALHLGQSTLLIRLVGEANKAVATRHATDGVCHDLGGLAGWKAVLEEGHENVFVDLGTKVADENGVLGSTVVAAKYD